MAHFHPSRDRRDIGQVVFLSEKMSVARAQSTCCIGAEALLSDGRRLDKLLSQQIRNSEIRGDGAEGRTKGFTSFFRFFLSATS